MASSRKRDLAIADFEAKDDNGKKARTTIDDPAALNGPSEFLFISSME
jgi:hypothetical protein